MSEEYFEINNGELKDVFFKPNGDFFKKIEKKYYLDNFKNLIINIKKKNFIFNQLKEIKAEE